MRLAPLALAVGVLAGAGSGSADEPQDRAVQVHPLADTSYRAVLNLDYEEGLAAARRLVALEPDESRSHLVLATVLWANMLFSTGAISVDHFLGSLTKSKDTRPQVPREVEREFEAEVTLAIELAEARLREHPDSVDARYAVGATHAIHASFSASMGGSLTAAFSSARRAYLAQEEVLERDPDHSGANVIAGTYRYVVSTLHFPSRWFAYLAGFSGGRERGIAMIEGAARSESAYDALPVLLLIYAREKRYDDALSVAERLARMFPRNRLFVLEVGSAALRAGRPVQAEQVLRSGIEALGREERPLAPGERAMWLYKRASALIELGRPSEAAHLLDQALTSSPLGWIEGRVHLERGKVADLAGRRTQAVEAYRRARAIAARDNDPMGRDAAEALIDRPFERGGEQRPRLPRPEGSREPTSSSNP